MSEAPYLDQIKMLVELQKVDDEIFAVKEKMKNTPRAVEELEQRFATLDARRRHVQDKLAHLQEQQRRLSSEIDDDSLKIKKSKNKLMQVGNSREYQAMLREMDSMEKINRNREAEKATLYEELRIQNEAFEELDKEYSTVKAELDTRRSTLEATLREAEGEIAELSKKREIAGKSIPGPIFMRYEFIRKRLEHPVIVDVEDGVCSGCNIAIPPQTFIELQSGQQILSCPNCQRLIFWGEHFDMPRSTPASKPAQTHVEAEEEPMEDSEAEDAETDENGDNSQEI